MPEPPVNNSLDILSALPGFSGYGLDEVSKIPVTAPLKIPGAVETPPAQQGWDQVKWNRETAFPHQGILNKETLAQVTGIGKESFGSGGLTLVLKAMGALANLSVVPRVLATETARIFFPKTFTPRVYEGFTDLLDTWGKEMLEKYPDVNKNMVASSLIRASYFISGLVPDLILDPLNRLTLGKDKLASVLDKAAKIAADAPGVKRGTVTLLENMAIALQGHVNSAVDPAEKALAMKELASVKSALSPARMNKGYSPDIADKLADTLKRDMGRLAKKVEAATGAEKDALAAQLRDMTTLQKQAVENANFTRNTIITRHLESVGVHPNYESMKLADPMIEEKIVPYTEEYLKKIGTSPEEIAKIMADPAEANTAKTIAYTKQFDNTVELYKELWRMGKGGIGFSTHGWLPFGTTKVSPEIIEKLGVSFPEAGKSGAPILRDMRQWEIEAPLGKPITYHPRMVLPFEKLNPFGVHLQDLGAVIKPAEEYIAGKSGVIPEPKSVGAKGEDILHEIIPADGYIKATPEVESLIRHTFFRDSEMAKNIPNDTRLVLSNIFGHSADAKEMSNGIIKAISEGLGFKFTFVGSTEKVEQQYNGLDAIFSYFGEPTVADKIKLASEAPDDVTKNQIYGSIIEGLRNNKHEYGKYQNKVETLIKTIAPIQGGLVNSDMVDSLNHAANALKSLRNSPTYYAGRVRNSLQDLLHYSIAYDPEMFDKLIQSVDQIVPVSGKAGGVIQDIGNVGKIQARKFLERLLSYPLGNLTDEAAAISQMKAYQENIINGLFHEGFTEESLRNIYQLPTNDISKNAESALEAFIGRQRSLLDSITDKGRRNELERILDDLLDSYKNTRLNIKTRNHREFAEKIIDEAAPRTTVAGRRKDYVAPKQGAFGTTSAATKAVKYLLKLPGNIENVNLRPEVRSIIDEIATKFNDQGITGYKTLDSSAHFGSPENDFASIHKMIEEARRKVDLMYTPGENDAIAHQNYKMLDNIEQNYSNIFNTYHDKRILWHPSMPVGRLMDYAAEVTNPEVKYIPNPEMDEAIKQTAYKMFGQERIDKFLRRQDMNEEDKLKKLAVSVRRLFETPHDMKLTEFKALDHELEFGHPAAGGDIKFALTDASAKELGFKLSSELVNKIWKDAKITKVSPDSIEFTLPNGTPVKIDAVAGEIELSPVGLAQAESLGMDLKKIVAEGRFTKLDRGFQIQVSKVHGSEAIANHENFHMAVKHFLPNEYSAMMKQFKGDEEAAARAYELYNPAKDLEGKSIFYKIWQFFSDLYHKFFPNAEEVFRRVQSGEVFKRTLPEVGRRSEAYSLAVNPELAKKDIPTLQKMVDSLPDSPEPNDYKLHREAWAALQDIKGREIDARITKASPAEAAVLKVIKEHLPQGAWDDDMTMGYITEDMRQNLAASPEMRTLLNKLPEEWRRTNLRGNSLLKDPQGESIFLRAIQEIRHDPRKPFAAAFLNQCYEVPNDIRRAFKEQVDGLNESITEMSKGDLSKYVGVENPLARAKAARDGWQARLDKIEPQLKQIEAAREILVGTPTIDIKPLESTFQFMIDNIMNPANKEFIWKIEQGIAANNEKLAGAIKANGAEKYVQQVYEDSIFDNNKILNPDGTPKDFSAEFRAAFPKLVKNSPEEKAAYTALSQNRKNYVLIDQLTHRTYSTNPLEDVNLNYIEFVIDPETGNVIDQIPMTKKMHYGVVMSSGQKRGTTIVNMEDPHTSIFPYIGDADRAGGNVRWTTKSGGQGQPRVDVPPDAIVTMPTLKQRLGTAVSAYPDNIAEVMPKGAVKEQSTLRKIMQGDFSKSGYLGTSGRAGINFDEFIKKSFPHGTNEFTKESILRAIEMEFIARRGSLEKILTDPERFAQAIRRDVDYLKGIKRATVGRSWEVTSKATKATLANGISRIIPFKDMDNPEEVSGAVQKLVDMGVPITTPIRKLTPAELAANNFPPNSDIWVNIKVSQARLGSEPEDVIGNRTWVSFIDMNAKRAYETKKALAKEKRGMLPIPSYEFTIDYRKYREIDDTRLNDPVYFNSLIESRPGKPNPFSAWKTGTRYEKATSAAEFNKGLVNIMRNTVDQFKNPEALFSTLENETRTNRAFNQEYQNAFWEANRKYLGRFNPSAGEAIPVPKPVILSPVVPSNEFIKGTNFLVPSTSARYTITRNTRDLLTKTLKEVTDDNEERGIYLIGKQVQGTDNIIISGIRVMGVKVEDPLHGPIPFPLPGGKIGEPLARGDVVVGFIHTHTNTTLPSMEDFAQMLTMKRQSQGKVDFLLGIAKVDSNLAGNPVSLGFVRMKNLPEKYPGSEGWGSPPTPWSNITTAEAAKALPEQKTIDTFYKIEHLTPDNEKEWNEFAIKMSNQIGEPPPSTNEIMNLVKQRSSLIQSMPDDERIAMRAYVSDLGNFGSYIFDPIGRMVDKYVAKITGGNVPDFTDVLYKQFEKLGDKFTYVYRQTIDKYYGPIESWLNMDRSFKGIQNVLTDQMHRILRAIKKAPEDPLSIVDKANNSLGIQKKAKPLQLFSFQKSDGSVIDNIEPVGNELLTKGIGVTPPMRLCEAMGQIEHAGFNRDEFIKNLWVEEYGRIPMESLGVESGGKIAFSPGEAEKFIQDAGAVYDEAMGYVAKDKQYSKMWDVVKDTHRVIDAALQKDVTQLNKATSFKGTRTFQDYDMKIGSRGAPQFLEFNSQGKRGDIKEAVDAFTKQVLDDPINPLERRFYINPENPSAGYTPAILNLYKNFIKNKYPNVMVDMDIGRYLPTQFTRLINAKASKSIVNILCQTAEDLSNLPEWQKKMHPENNFVFFHKYVEENGKRIYAEAVPEGMENIAAINELNWVSSVLSPRYKGEIWVHKDLANIIKDIKQNYSYFDDDVLKDTIMEISSIIKTTNLYDLFFHLKSITSNGIMSSGVTLTDLDPRRLMKYADMIEDGDPMALQALRDGAFPHGVTDWRLTPQAAIDQHLGQKLDFDKFSAKYNHWFTNLPYVKQTQRILWGYIDKPLRLMMYERGLARGLSGVDAADWVNTALVDYTMKRAPNKSKAIGYMFFPFLAWVSGNLMFHSHEMIAQPGRYLMLYKMMNAINHEAVGNEMYENPEGFEMKLATRHFTPEGQRMYVDWALPVKDIIHPWERVMTEIEHHGFAYGVIRGLTQWAAGRMQPGIKEFINMLRYQAKGVPSEDMKLAKEQMGVTEKILTNPVFKVFGWGYAAPLKNLAYKRYWGALINAFGGYTSYDPKNAPVSDIIQQAFDSAFGGKGYEEQIKQ